MSERWQANRVTDVIVEPWHTAGRWKLRGFRIMNPNHCVSIGDLTLADLAVLAGKIEGVLAKHAWDEVLGQHAGPAAEDGDQDAAGG